MGAKGILSKQNKPGENCRAGPLLKHYGGKLLKFYVDNLVEHVARSKFPKDQVDLVYGPPRQKSLNPSISLSATDTTNSSIAHHNSSNTNSSSSKPRKKQTTTGGHPYHLEIIEAITYVISLFLCDNLPNITRKMKENTKIRCCIFKGVPNISRWKKESR